MVSCELLSLSASLRQSRNASTYTVLSVNLSRQLTKFGVVPQQRCHFHRDWHSFFRCVIRARNSLPNSISTEMHVMLGSLTTAFTSTTVSTSTASGALDACVPNSFVAITRRQKCLASLTNWAADDQPRDRVWNLHRTHVDFNTVSSALMTHLHFENWADDDADAQYSN